MRVKIALDSALASRNYSNVASNYKDSVPTNTKDPVEISNERVNAANNMPSGWHNPRDTQEISCQKIRQIK